MSSISPSDRANQTDEIRRIREDYENKEAENTKKKNKEIKSMNEKQDQELTKVRDEYNEQLESLRGKHNEQLDERDKRHTEDISKIREMYVDSLRKKSVEEVRERETNKSTYEGELSKEKQIAAQQRDTSERGFRQSLAERDRQLTDHQNRSVAALQQGLESRTEKLNEKHQSELAGVAEDRDRKVGELLHTVDQVKDTYGERLATEDRNHKAEMDRRNSAFETVYRNQEHNNSELIRNRDAQLSEARSSLNDKYTGKIQEQTDKMTALREKYAEEMDSRTGAQVREAKAEISQAKNDNVLEAITNRRIRDIERSHLIGAYQAREEDLTRQKSEIFDKVNDVARERVNNVINRTEKLVTDANRKNRMEQDVQSMRTKEALAQQENFTKDQVLLTNNRADQRVRKVMQSSNTAQKNEIRQHEENLDDLRHNYSDNLQNQREAQVDSIKNIYSRMDQKLRDLEAHLTKKHDDAVEFYESKIDEIANQNKKESQRLNHTFEARFNQREKAVKMEEDGLAKKYEQKMAIQEDIHQKDLNRLEKRHQEQIQAVVARAAAAQSKKA